MYSIGDFSKINRVTPKTLRHYDRIGLLKPDRVDDWTGYRYYSGSQLPRMRRILRLKALGLSLEEIRSAVGENEDLFDILQRQEGRLGAVMTTLHVEVRPPIQVLHERVPGKHFRRRRGRRSGRIFDTRVRRRRGRS